MIISFQRDLNSLTISLEVCVIERALVIWFEKLTYRHGSNLALKIRYSLFDPINTGYCLFTRVVLDIIVLLP